MNNQPYGINAAKREAALKHKKMRNIGIALIVLLVLACSV